MRAIGAGKHILCEKPFTDTADQAKEVFDAAANAGVVCWEGMWLRFFPAVEHARAAIERGDIGDVCVVQGGLPRPSLRSKSCNHRVRCRRNAGHSLQQVVKREQQPYANDVFSAHGGSPSAAVLQYSDQEGIAVITFPNGRFIEESQYIGTKGRITVETPSHHPSAVTIRTGRPGRRGTRREEGKPVMELDPAQRDGRVIGSKHTGNKTGTQVLDRFNQIDRFEYPVPTPAPQLQEVSHQALVGIGERLIKYKGWTWHGGQSARLLHTKLKQCIVVWAPVFLRCHNGRLRSQFESAKSSTRSTDSALSAGSRS